MKAVKNTGQAMDILKTTFAKGIPAKKRSKIAKKAQTGVDMGAKGKNFSKIAAKAGGGTMGDKIAGAVFWKKMAGKK